MLTVYDPVTNTKKTIDPSQIPGFYGDFTCKDPSGQHKCNVVYMDIDTETGDFAFDFSTNK